MDRFGNATAVYSPRWVEILSAAWLCIILFAGTLLNGLTVFVFVRNKHLITNNNVYVLALIFHDLCLSCIATEMPIVAEVCGHWLHIMTMKACVFEAFLVYFVGLASMFILVAMAASRYIAITRPFLATRLTKRLSVFVVCLCDFLALCFAVPPLFGWGTYGLEAHGTSCGLDWRDTTDSFLSYLIIITIVCLAIPLAAMIFCYTRIYFSVKEAGANCAPGTGYTHASRLRKERMLLRLSFAFVLTFVLSWTPYTIVSFYVAYGKPESIDPFLSRSAALVAKSQVLWNPILYIGITDSFRKRALDLFRCRERNRRRDVDSEPSNFISNRPNTEQTVTIVRTIQRIFTISGLSGVAASLNMLRRSPRLVSFSREKNAAKERKNIRSINGCTQQASGNKSMIEENKGEEGASCSSNNIGLQTEIHSDLAGTSSIVEVKPESSKESNESSKQSLSSSTRVKTTRIGSGVFDDESFEKKASPLHRSVVKNSPEKLRTQENSFCGNVELHIHEDSRRGNGVDVNSTMCKSYGIVINVINVNNELIPID